VKDAFWIALFGGALEQFSRLDFGREKSEHANAPIVKLLCLLQPPNLKVHFSFFKARASSAGHAAFEVEHTVLKGAPSDSAV